MKKHAVHQLVGGKTQANYDHLRDVHAWQGSTMDEPWTLPWSMLAGRHANQHQEEALLGPDTPVYVVWGPTAEWGDGDGPLSYWLTRTMAEADKRSFEISDEEYIADGRRDTNDPTFDGGWPRNLGRGYRIEQATLMHVSGAFTEAGFADWLSATTNQGPPWIMNGDLHEAIEDALNAN